MSSTMLFRLSGLSLLLGVLLYLIYLFTHPQSSGLAYYAAPGFACNPNYLSLK